MQELHKEMGGTKQFLQSAVATDLVQIEQNLLAELPVSLRQETLFSELSDVFRFNQSDFLIAILLAKPSQSLTSASPARGGA